MRIHRIAHLVGVVVLVNCIGPSIFGGNPFELSVRGAVQVALGPPEAVAAGAAFSLDASPLQDSALVSDLEPGSHLLQFRPLPGWIEPSDRDILIVGGAKRDLAFEYTRLQSFYFKGVPPQTAHAGTPLRIVIRSSDAGDPASPPPGTKLSFSASPQPAGAISFDPDAGEFRYQVAPEDRRDFTVTFRAATPAGPAEGTVVISPAPALPPEDTVLHFDRPMPDPLSRDYLQIREAKSATPETFNHRGDVTTRSVSISGRHLLFEAGSTLSDLHARYDGDDDIKEFKLYADLITIRSPLRIPGAHVEIHARELRFEKHGLINVTPRDWFAGKPTDVAVEDDPGTPENESVAKNGANGLASPPMEVFVEAFHSDPDPQNPGVPPRRFILRGARAQDAGEGRDGRNILQPGTVFCGTFNGIYIVYAICTLSDGTVVGECGLGFPHAENAVSAGVPGLGGAGGTFTSALGPDMAPFLDLDRGADGARGLDRAGGIVSPKTFYMETATTTRGGEPCDVVSHTKVTTRAGAAAVAPGPFRPCSCVAYRELTDAEITLECEAIATVAVADCPAECRGRPTCIRACEAEGDNLRAECLANPDAFLPKETRCMEWRCAGEPGRVVQSTDPGAWLHPHLVRSTLLYVKDAYLNERIPEAQAILEEYRELILALKGSLPPGQEADEFFQLLQEIDSLLHRMGANLDYFGNPVTWVPLLSFEANLAAFEEEVERAIPTLYLGYWVQAAARQAGRTRDAAIEARARLEQEINALAVDHALAQEEMPALLAEAEALDGKVTEVTANLVALEANLERRAQENVNERHKVPFWKKALGVLGGVTKIIPLGQPALGYVGVGLGLLSKFDPDHPLANLDKLPDLIKAVKSNPYALCAKGKAEESKENPRKENKLTLTERARACHASSKLGITDIREALKETKADKTEVEAELEKLRAADPVFLGTTQEIEKLNAEKQRLGERIASTLDRLTKFASAVNENELAIDQLDRDLTGALDALDHRSVLYVADMVRRSTDRLLSYQYLMARAYQFRTLKPYTGNLHLERIIERVRELIDFQDSAPVISPAQFDVLKSIYLEEVGRIAKDIFDDLGANGPEHSEPVSFRLTAQELATLNSEKTLEIDLAKKGLFGANQEDLRIVSIEQLPQVRVIGTLGTTATLRLRLEHSGFSRISRRGDTYLFTHYRTERVNPITWGAVHDALSGTTTETRISAATDSLLRFLLNLPSAESVILYSLPSATAKLVLSREVTADNGVDLEVEALTLKVTYDYASASTANRRLEVQVSDDLGPRILLDRSDQNGRQDGLGGFVRSFAGPGTVQLEAPATHGSWTFDHWELDGLEAGGGAAMSRLIEVSLNTDRRALAIYRSTQPQRGNLFWRGDSNGDGAINITDAVSILAFLFTGGVEPGCKDAADANDDGSLNITDAIFVLGYLFLGGEGPPAPGFHVCGADPTADQLENCLFEACR